MIFWIRKIAAALAIGAFFLLFFTGLAGAKTFEWSTLAAVFVRAFAGASLFWVVGIVIADILLKGIITDITVDRKGLLEGGLLQQVHSIQRKAGPGGSEMPVAEMGQMKTKGKSGEKP